MANEFLIERVALGTFSFPANSAGNTGSTLSADANVYIPAGAIVNDIKYFVPGELTNMANMSNGTINVAVGSIVLGTSNLAATNALVQTVAASQAIAGGNGALYIPTGGNLQVNFASSNSARTGIAGAGSVYVKYLK